jgi:hypothetical protein
LDQRFTEFFLEGSGTETVATRKTPEISKIARGQTNSPEIGPNRLRPWDVAGPVKSGAAICALMSTRPKNEFASLFSTLVHFIPLFLKHSAFGWTDIEVKNEVDLIERVHTRYQAHRD